MRAATELGAFEVEIDLQLSRDGVVVAFHDQDLGEKTLLRGRVADHDAAALTDIDIGSWFDRTHPDAPERHAGERVATLDQIFDAFGAALHYHLELKSDGPELAAAVVRAVRARGLMSRATLSSSHFSALQKVRELAPELDTCLLLGDRAELAAEAASRGASGAGLLAWQRHWLERAHAAGFRQVGMPSEDLSAEIVAAAHARGLQVQAYRIRDDALMRRAIELGSNGMTTNWPDRLIRALLEHMAR